MTLIEIVHLNFAEEPQVDDVVGNVGDVGDVLVPGVRLQPCLCRPERVSKAQDAG